MALTNSKYNPTGIANRANGSLSGTYTAATVTSTVSGAAIASGVLTLTLGFAPKYFKVINCTDRITQEWFQGMNAGDFIETAAAGTRTLETDDQVVVSGNTVTVTFAGGAATDNDTVVWVAEG